MIERVPDYYHKFLCLAGACPDSCCQEWEVDIDAKTAALYRNLSGPLGDTLREKMREENGEIYLTISDRRCPMWRSDGLCEIQCQLGHDFISNTCRQFPRLTHDYGDFVERGLELSCPAAAALILSGKDQALTENLLPGGEQGDYDRQVMDILLKSRNTLLSFWEESPRSLPQMLAITLLYAHGVQSQIDGGEEAAFSPQELLIQAEYLALPGNTEAIFDFFRSLEILTPRWQARLSSPAPALWPEELKYFVRYGILRYYLQSVSDYDLICRIKWLVIACLLLGHLGGNFAENVQLFSKEIENSSDNMEALFNAAYTSPAFTDRALLGLLLK